MTIKENVGGSVLVLPLILHISVFGLFLSTLPGVAAESVCATVEIEVNQELTLEREGFDAHMRINNGFENVFLNNVGIDVKFSDAEGRSVLATADPDNTNALFYIQVDSMSGISDVSGSGTVNPATSADIHWLIIPSQGAGGSNVQGVLYYVGATLSYRIGEASNVTEVTPDYIYVKPMPNLALDYFLPGQVYGDDAFTPEVEPPVPYSIGLRVKNIGYGAARNFKIESCQPEIIANANGLLIGFSIRGCEINGMPQQNTLLLDLGNIAPGVAYAARWTMTTTLSGTFTNFTAGFSHSDELGGRLTSLIKPENLKTHMLLHDVLVDIGGRDPVRDYLASDGKVYESEGIDSVVTNISAGAQLTPTGTNYLLTLPYSQAGFIYISLTNPVNTDMSIATVTRSDGKQIKEANAWISKERKPNPAEGWNYFFNLFDANPSNCSYTIAFTSSTNLNHAPVVAVLDSTTAFAGENLCVKVQGSDEDGAIPALNTGNLPIGARFLDLGNGSGVFSWTPTTGQLGDYWVRFEATDGMLTNSKSTKISVLSAPVMPWPGWWQRREVIMSAPAGANDYAAVNQGQVKHISRSAWDELETLPGGAGFTLAVSNVQNYAAVNLGQLKHVAAPFYDRLYLVWPWLGAPATNDFAIANIGQVKNLFGFNPWRDSDSDGIPDWWEQKYSFCATNALDAVLDANTNGIPNVEEYIRNTDPR